jgi:hypothetical protein
MLDRSTRTAAVSEKGVEGGTVGLRQERAFASLFFLSRTAQVARPAPAKGPTE